MSNGGDSGASSRFPARHASEMLLARPASQAGSTSQRRPSTAWSVGVAGLHLLALTPVLPAGTEYRINNAIETLNI